MQITHCHCAWSGFVFHVIKSQTKKAMRIKVYTEGREFFLDEIRMLDEPTGILEIPNDIFNISKSEAKCLFDIVAAVTAYETKRERRSSV